MDAAVFKDQLFGLVNSMFREGYLDDQFTQLQMLQDANNPGFVAEVISLFCEDSERILAELTKSLDQAVVDFNKVDAYVHQLKGSSSSIGAHHVKLACVDFRSYCEERNREGGTVVLLLIGAAGYLWCFHFIYEKIVGLLLPTLQQLLLLLKGSATNSANVVDREPENSAL